MNENTICHVTNRSNSTVAYKNEAGIQRIFMPSETKKIPYEELEKLSLTRGGMNIIQKYLLIKNTEAIKSLEIHVEPEYNMTETDVTKMLLEGSLDQLLDCLDFAPEGVIQLVKTIAVKIRLNDVSKREAIKEKTGFDISAAIANIDAEKAAEKENAVEPTKQRRVQVEEEKPAGRRTIPNYKVVGETE